MKKILPVVGLGLLVALGASAHVIVTPNTAGIGSFQVFSMAVPAEEDVPTTAIKLMIPDGLEFVVPNVKPGWQVQVKTVATGKKITDDDGDQVAEMKPTEIDWTGGSIPSGQRDEFSFQAQVPASATALDWKAYQTYSDGSVVAWDQTPSNTAENPYSVTQVVNDLTNTPSTTATTDTKENITLLLSVVALLVALYAAMKKPSAN